MAQTRDKLVTVTFEESGLRRLDKLAQLLDAAVGIPGTRFRIGLDGLLGLIPGVGDTLGALLSGYIILEAARLGFPKQILLRMVGNVAIETLVGAVPIVGDIFDIAWKANVKNLALLRAHQAHHVQEAVTGEYAPRRISSLIIIVLILAVIGLIALSVVILQLLYQLVTA